MIPFSIFIHLFFSHMLFRQVTNFQTRVFQPILFVLNMERYSYELFQSMFSLKSKRQTDGL